MTEPQPTPTPMPYEWTVRPTWCRVCELHQATANGPTCPVCLDDERLDDERQAAAS